MRNHHWRECLHRRGDILGTSAHVGVIAHRGGKLGFLDRAILRVKRADSPVTRLLKKSLQQLYSPTLPPLPGILKPPLRVVYEFHFLVISAFRALLVLGYKNPVFQSRCAHFGKRVRIAGLPFVSGHVEIYVGDDVGFGGNVNIMSGGIFEQPRLILKDRADLGWNVSITVNREVVIEEDARVSFDCRISDCDGHPRETDRRAAGLPPDPKDVRPVRIGRGAWIGNGAHIMKGVTIGEGAVIGANSVVIMDIPPYALAIGNPAEVLIKNFSLPAAARNKARVPVTSNTSCE